MNDSPIDPYDALRSYLEAVQPYLVAMQQAYDQLIDLGEAPTIGTTMPSFGTPASASRPQQHPSPARPDLYPNDRDGSANSGESSTPRRGPALGSTHAVSSPNRWANPAVKTLHTPRQTPLSNTTSDPFQNSMWPSQLPFRTETLPQNPPDNDHDQLAMAQP